MAKEPQDRKPKGSGKAKRTPPEVKHQLELTADELAFLRLLCTNATIQPAALKKLCGSVQEKVEAIIGPLGEEPGVPG